MFWGSMMEQVLDLLKHERISAGALVLLACTLFWVHAWADDKFATIDDLQALQQTVVEGFESILISDASAEIRDIKLSQQMAKATGAPIEELGRIQEQLEHAEAYKSCLVKQEPNCDHLRDVQ